MWDSKSWNEQKNFGLLTHFRSSLSYLMCLNLYSANQDLSIHTFLSKFIDPHECVILCFHFAKMHRIFSTRKNAFKDRKSSVKSFIKVFKKVESNNIAPIRIKWIAKLKRIHELLIFGWPNSDLFLAFLPIQIVNDIDVALILLSELFQFNQTKQIVQICKKCALQKALFTFRKSFLSNWSKYRS